MSGVNTAEKETRIKLFVVEVKTIIGNLVPPDENPP